MFNREKKQRKDFRLINYFVVTVLEFGSTLLTNETLVSVC
jgi:hypothetical protein